MPQLEVTVKRLNKRRVIPNQLPDPANIAGEVFLDHYFDGEEVAAVPNPALGKWYVDRDGYYYWGGGLRENVPQNEIFKNEQLDEAGVFPWWLKNDRYSIPAIWKNEPLQEVTIAILDTGINEHVDFDFTKIKGFNYLDNSTNYKNDAFGHGTHLAGIMVAKGIKTFGIIPSANLFVAKVSNDSGTPSFTAVRNALSDIYNKRNGADDIDVINMSFKLIASDDPEEEQVIAEIKELIKKIYLNNSITLVSSCGDRNQEIDNFPASLDECISVGSVNVDFQKSTFSTRSITLDIMAPGERINSTLGIDSITEKKGTSQSAAIVSAVCAMGIKEFKNRGIRNNWLLKKALFQSAFNNFFELKDYGHGILNPNAFIQKIKSLI